ncbi:uncharacterized protein PITG_04569 [Phytophthora infestans T30-4]|uniref:Uncharacterized protein n=1 Tax=Phytophthora infestans (strain T30-4) TaxID=403677 RepID=D0N1J1_PHYIT|nr:uncharacterized protein PITG_04569 [Phytophthora infestans T30-4]EEY68170.1 conserved hypothetical protein [Phytophthora infestans T30-4]|eukprot:XP_002905329.1 conserved hypothetical protein [Phytophthora infestans T30-4]
MGGDTKPPDGEPPPPQRRLSKKTAVVKEEVKDLVTPPGPPAMGGSKPYGNMKSELEILPHKEQSEEGASLHTGDREESEDPAVEDKTRSENDDESMGWSGSEPLVFDDVKVEPLTFTEMFEYLRCETAGMDLDKAMEVESVADLIQDLFEQVFLARPRDPLPPTRARYPDLSKGETEKLLHYTEATTTNYDSRKWRARLEGLARSIYKSRRTLSETLSAAEQAVKARPAPVANPWEQRLFPQSTAEFFLGRGNDKNDSKKNVHTEKLGAETNPEQRAKQVWARQIGVDGILNEQPRDRYHIRLLNISRFMDEAAIDMFLQAHFSGTYTTWQEPCTGYNNVLQTDTWDIFFKCHTCPQFLDSKRFINWNGTKILVHHVTAGYHQTRNAKQHHRHGNMKRKDAWEETMEEVHGKKPNEQKSRQTRKLLTHLRQTILGILGSVDDWIEHGYDETIDPKAKKLTPKQTETKLKKYFEEVARSTSRVEATIPTKYWGVASTATEHGIHVQIHAKSIRYGNRDQLELDPN